LFEKNNTKKTTKIIMLNVTLITNLDVICQVRLGNDTDISKTEVADQKDKEHKFTFHMENAKDQQIYIQVHDSEYVGEITYPLENVKDKSIRLEAFLEYGNKKSQGKIVITLSSNNIRSSTPLRPVQSYRKMLWCSNYRNQWDYFSTDICDQFEAAFKNQSTLNIKGLYGDNADYTVDFNRYKIINLSDPKSPEIDIGRVRPRASNTPIPGDKSKRIVSGLNISWIRSGVMLFVAEFVTSSK